MIKRIYIPGDEWLYYKIYCGSKTADEILTDVILPATIHLNKNGIIDGWFFIRYSDPDLHLRVRFHFNDILAIVEIMNIINHYIKPFIEYDKVWKVMCDTYQREIERYHIKAIELGEQLFCADSQMIINFLDIIDGDEGEKIRWMFSFISIDNLLTNFGFMQEKKLKLMEKIKNGFAQEFGMNKYLKLQLDKKFRQHRSDIEDIMSIKKENAGELLPLLQLLEDRAKTNKQLADKLKQLSTIEPTVSIDELLPSYIHMLMNRLFRSKQRIHEMVVYDFLWRYYKSEIAKAKYFKQNNNKLAHTKIS